MKKRKIDFLAYGKETCPKSGRLHHQTYFYFKNARSGIPSALKKMGDWWGDTHCFVEGMRGNFKDNEEYCSKESTLTKLGEEPKQGFRGDLEETAQAIQNGDVTVDEIAVTDPTMFHQYGRTLERIETIALRRRWRTEMTEGLWITGPSHSGKSHEAFEGYHPDTHFVKDLSCEWWDGYKGQEIVILNEFRGQIPFSELLALVDKWPHMVKQRCRESVPFLAKKVIVTSILSPEACYHGKTGDEPWSQFHRRFKLTQKCSEGNITTSEPKTVDMFSI